MMKNKNQNNKIRIDQVMINNIINISPVRCDMLHNLYESIGEGQDDIGS